MKTYLDCIPCLFRQALDGARIAGATNGLQKRILDELGSILPDFSLNASPPEIARIVNQLIKKHTKKDDLYRAIKQKSNKLALSIYPQLQQKINKSKDRLHMAVQLAIAGNIIDYGVKNSLNIEQELEKILKQETALIKQENSRLFAYSEFKKVVKKATTILYLGDNAGEVVFDKVLLEEIKRIDPHKDIVYAVKEKPIINDALKEDACFCGLDQLAHIISSGSDAPGTVLSICSKDFLTVYRRADMIISKGQGNFEALSASKRAIFFLFMAKCPVVAKQVDANVGDIILRYSGESF